MIKVYKNVTEYHETTKETKSFLNVFFNIYYDIILLIYVHEPKSKQNIKLKTDANNSLTFVYSIDDWCRGQRIMVSSNNKTMPERTKQP